MHGYEFPMGFTSVESMERHGILPYNGLRYKPTEDSKKRDLKQKKEGRDYYSDDSDDEGFKYALERIWYNQRVHRPFNHSEHLEDIRVMRDLMVGGEP